MIIGGTIFTHKNIHKVTWRLPDGDTMSQIGHILIQRKHSPNLKDVRCKRGVNVDSDRHLVMADVQARISMNKIRKGQRMSKYNVQSLEKGDVQQTFRSKIMELNGSIYADEESQKGIEKQWSICGKIMKEVAESTIGGMEGPPQRNDWVDDECAAATSLKNRAYMDMLAKKNTRRATEEYQRRRFEEKKIHRRKKREAWKGLMEEAGRQKETRKFYRKVNIIRNGYKPRKVMCKDKKGNLITEKKKVLQRWTEHFDELLNGHVEEDRNKGVGEGETGDMEESLDKEEDGINRNLEMTDVPTKEEVKIAVDK
jgi:hypothetical protein